MTEKERFNLTTITMRITFVTVLLLGVVACQSASEDRRGPKSFSPTPSSTHLANRATELSAAATVTPVAAPSRMPTSAVCRKLSPARIQALASNPSPIEVALGRPFGILEDSEKRLVPSGAISAPNNALAWQDDLLYVGHEFGLTILDVSTPEQATRLATMLLPFEPATFAIDGDVLYAGTIQDWEATGTEQQLALIDVSDPSAPVLRGRLGGLTGAIDLAVLPGGNRVLVAARE